MIRKPRQTATKQRRPAEKDHSTPAQSVFDVALQHHRAGRLADAERLYRQALAIEPRHADSLHLLGVVTHMEGRHDVAISLISAAIAINPNVAPYHCNLGNMLREQGRLDEAVASLRRAVNLSSQFPEAHYNLGVALAEQRRQDEAVLCYRRAIALNPDYLDAHNNLSIILLEQGRPDEATTCRRAIVALQPVNPEAHFRLGEALSRQGQWDEAAACYRATIDLKPDYSEAHHSLGIALSHQERWDEAVGCYRTAVELKPDSPEAHSNLGSALREQGRLEETVTCYLMAIGLAPNRADAHSNLGIALKELGRPDEAVIASRRAIDLQPDFAEAHNTLGNALRGQGRLEEAVACYRQAVELKPGYALAHCNLAMALLAAGDMAAGWEEYEWRWKTPHWLQASRDFAEPLWRGGAADGQTLLIHAEQGYGDTLQFCRYASLAAAKGPRVILEVPRPLVRLLRGLPGVDRVVAAGETLPAFDLHCPMLSLPLALQTTLATIPNASPYLQADADQVDIWRTRLAAMATQGPLVGLVWAGAARAALALAAIDRRRSLAPDRLAPLFDLPGAHFFSLQREGPAAPESFPLADFMDEMEDFADTAALVANLDLVISVDTAVAHLAAALGKPVWLLDRFDPCWRWLTGRRDSPWYPSLRLYRQPRAGDWDSVISEVGRDLRTFTPARGPVQPETPAGTLVARTKLASVKTLFADAFQHHQAGRLAAAEQLYRHVLAIDPRHADSLHLLGVVTHQNERHDLAAEMIRQAITINPCVASYHSNLGAAIKELGRLDEAATCYRKALDLKPDFPDAHYNLGNVLRELRLPDQAVASYRAALRIRPDYVEAHYALGDVLKEHGRWDEAVACFHRALEIDPDYAEAHNILGNALREQRRLAEALACYGRALELKPGFPEAHTNRAMALLALGDMTAGWEEYEWRWKLPQSIDACRDFAQPQWRGEAAAGRTLLIHAEQGFGDTLQFCRYAPLAAERGLRVVLEVPKPLVRLLRCLPGVERVVAAGEALPAFDLHCPMLSMPLAMRTTLATIPSAAAYLHADETQIAACRARLGTMARQGLRVGLVWAGNPRMHLSNAAATDRRRSLTLERLAPLFDGPGVHFFSLQKDGAAAPANVPLTDLMPEMTDFADTAALIANLDLVISVDTAVAHLAAALGKPVWILDRFDPCWRWPTDRRDSPWYPTLRLYRQPQPGDWSPVLAEAAHDLRTLAGAHEPRATGPTHGASPSVQTMFAAALQHHQAERLTEAEQLYRQVLTADPRHADSLHLLGVVTHLMGRQGPAVDLINEAIAIRPNVAAYHSNLGNMLREQQRPHEAITCLQSAIDLNPNDPGTHYNLGIALGELGRLDEAVHSYRRAIELSPIYCEAHHNLGIALGEQGRLDEAVASLRRAIELKPGSPHAHNSLGTTLQKQERLDEAVDCFRGAINLSPDYPEAHFNLGTALGEQGRMEEAAACYRAALGLRPDYPDARYNLGTMLRQQGRLDEAVACFQEVLHLKPDNPEAHLKLATTLLVRGDLAAGWEEYEWRWKTPQMANARRDFTQPQWQGEPARGQTLLIHAEQGLGDSIQFCRYAPLAAARGLRVIMEVPKPLTRLLRGLPGVDLVMARGEALPPFDLHCPMLSMPLAMRTTLTTIPGAASYLRADEVRVAAWRTRLAAMANQGPRIGLVWAGSAKSSGDRWRSLAPDRLAPLFETTGGHFFSLQKYGPAAPISFPMTDFMSEMGDFADTAALIANLDLVISVDTAVAHLAAALGKPVWLMDRFAPDFRWLAGRRDSPWYPSLRLYRQPQPGDWDTVLAEVAADLRHFAEARASRPEGVQPVIQIAQPVSSPAQTIFASALQHHQAGRLSDAERLYRQVLAVDPRDADSLHLLGVVNHQRGRHDLAVAMVGEAIAINAGVASYHCNLGAAINAQGRPDEAIVCYRRALDLQPDMPEAHNCLGSALLDQERPDEAVACYRRAIDLRPDYADAHNNLGNALKGLGQFAEAAICYRKAIQLQPDLPGSHSNLGIALKEQGDLDEAVACHRRAIELAPGFAPAHGNLGNALIEQGQLEAAVTCYRRSIELGPDTAGPHSSLGNALKILGRFDEAVTCCRRAIELRPDFADAFNNLGNALRGQGWLDEAVTAYDRAIDLKPDYPQARFNRSLALLARGDLAAGWEEYEWRWKTAGMIEAHRDFPQPQWRGESAAGQTLLIHAEQGYGDTLQFCRYATMAAARGLRVIMEAPAPLVRLLRGLAGVDLVVECGEALPAFDLHCPMLSMPLAMQTILATIPGAASYLKADEARVASWRTRLDAMGNQGLRVGLVWAGNPRSQIPALTAVDRRRSMAPDHLAPLTEVAGLHLISLQKGGPAAPASFPLTDFMPEMTDFADTAALIANLDLVIAVDTAVAHLAAALGKPVWLLDRFDPCWRWLTGRRDSPWYPTLRIYRQPRPGDWASVLTEVAGDLRGLAEARKPRLVETRPGRLMTSPAPPDVQAIFASAIQHHQAGHLSEAEQLYRQVLAADPRHADSLHLLGVVTHLTGRHDPAVALINEAIAINPNSAPFHSNLGNMLREQGRVDEAIACLGRAIELNPDDPGTHYNLGIALAEQGRLDEAVRRYHRAVDLKSDYPEAHNNLGIALGEQGRLDEAVSRHRRVVGLQPDSPDAHFSLGGILTRQRRWDEAAGCFRKALDLKPDFADAHNNLAMALLALGEMTAGWEEYEWRWRTSVMTGSRRGFAQPQWKGEAADGQTLLIHAEQGFGDTLQFCRYASLAAARGLRVIMEVQQPLVRLLRTLPGVDRVLTRGGPLPVFDLHCPMLSMPLALGTTLTTIPSTEFYLRADEAQVAAWNARLSAMSHQGPRIGLVWAGNPGIQLPDAAAVDRRRSLAPERLAPLFDVPGVHFFSLQKGRPRAPNDLTLTDFMHEMSDFADTAALIANLDLVISVDTAVAHLAAALGKPVWLLNRFDSCWRWLTGRRDSPWYPSLRLYHQPRPGDWGPVLAEVAEDLRSFVGVSAIQETIAAHRAGRLHEAADLYRQVLAIDPRHADSLHLLGVLKHQMGRHDEAVAMIREAIGINPESTSYHSNLASVFKGQGRLDEAIACVRRVIELKPNAPDGHKGLAILLKEQGCLDEAVACFRRVVELSPDLPEAYHDLGNALRTQGRLEEAIVCYRVALKLNTDLPGIHNSLGNALMELGRWEEAVVCYRRAHALRPDSPDAHNNLGNGLVRQGRLNEAVARYGEAIDLKPDFAEAHSNLGTVLKQQMRLDEAVVAFRRAIELKPDFPEAHDHLAMTLLAQGDMTAGWEELEWRWKTSHFSDARRDLTQPRWRGEPAAGRTLLIYAEQGLGDTLQFCRYAQIAAARGLRVILEVQQPLARLLRALPGVDLVVVSGERLPDFDIHCPMLSLPLALRTTLATIPGPASYLCAGEAQAAAWQTRLAAMADRGLRVGLVWAGNPRSHFPALATIDRRRSLAPHRLASLFDVPGVRFFSLQKDGPGAPADFPLTDFMSEMSDFADTAALIANLDLVISVDTAVAHLAAALGKPVWLLNRFDSCWRWLVGRRDSPWYPSLRLYRQPQPGDWESVLAEIAHDLRGFADGHEPRPAETRDHDGAIPRIMAQALQHHRAGRLHEAADLYRQVLAIDPRHADSLHLLGVVTHQMGRHDEAVAMIGEAIKISPRSASYHSNLAAVFKEQGRLEEAIACVRRIIELKPDAPDGYQGLAILCKERGRLDEAVACFRHIVELNPNLPDAHNDLGSALKAHGQLADAVASYRTALDLDPDLAGVHNNLGTALMEQGQLDEAAASYRTALGLKPDFPDAHNNLAILLKEQGRLDEVTACFRAVVGLRPESPAAHHNLGGALKEQGRLDEAVICYRRAITLMPDYLEAHNNLGIALLDQGQPEEAILVLRRAMELKPDYPELHSNLGNALRGQGDLNGAVACYRRALVLKPDSVAGHFNLGMALLAQGDMAAGWEEYEWRWQAPEGIKDGRDFAQPQWKGEAAAGQTLLIHAEQGFGDTLQFCRYATLAGARGLRVILEVQQPLVRLLRGLPGVHRVIARGERLPAFDLHCPMLSLPLALGTTIETIPTAVPYLHADATQITAWRTRLAAMPNQGLRVGLVWAGNPRLHIPAGAVIDRRRSLAPGYLTPLFNVPDVHFFSLQKDGLVAPAEFPLINFMQEMTDFADTAALIANLDLVIAVDTAVAHLAAAQGKPVWLLDRFDPCWRWLTGRRGSPWYPTLRIYRQPRPGDWDSVLAEVAGDLRSLADAHISRRAEAKPGRPVLNAASPSAQFADALEHHKAGRLNEAEGLCRQVLAADPHHADSLHLLGVVAYQTGRHETAVQMISEAITIKPGTASYHSNLCAPLHELGRLDEAVTHGRRACDLDPSATRALINLGAALRSKSRLDDAAACFRRALDIDAGYPDAHFALGMSLLAQGDMAPGWEECEWRWNTPQLIKERRDFAQRQWRGEAEAGQTLLIHAEQGFGDTLQFCRYAPLAGASGLRVILEVQAPLARLLRGLPEVHQVIRRGEQLPPFDLHCPMLSLPLAMRTTSQPFPARHPICMPTRCRLKGGEPALPQSPTRVRGSVWSGRAVPAFLCRVPRRSIVAARCPRICWHPCSKCPAPTLSACKSLAARHRLSSR